MSTYIAPTEKDTEHPLYLPSIRRSSNTHAYGIVPGDEVSGQRWVANLDDLYHIPVPILSRFNGYTTGLTTDTELDANGNPTGPRTNRQVTLLHPGDDALMQEWYVVSVGAFYRLIDWKNRTNASGWEQVVDSSSMTIKEVEAADENTLKSYQLCYNKKGAGTGDVFVGEKINIPKDRTIQDIRLGHNDDTIDDKGNIVDSGNTDSKKVSLNISYILANGTYKLVHIDVASFLQESEFGDGLKVEDGVVSIKIGKDSSNCLGASSDGLDVLTDKPLATPRITGEWRIFKYDGVEETDRISRPAITLEYGYKAQFIGSYKWIGDTSHKDPTDILPNSSWDDLPASNTDSNIITTGIRGNDFAASVSLSAPKRGLEVVNGSKIVPATGSDVISSSWRVAFKNRIYYGVTTNGSPTEKDITGMGSLLGDKEQTISGVSANTTQYFVYAYPKSLGLLKAVIQGGALEILDAFATPYTLTITNKAGMPVELYVYVSNRTGAFNNAGLTFK